jgi:tetratricopeptide (TPR) repeat protein
VQQLKDAGNWNVFVLHAAKWTREEPNNAAAWNELAIGYTKLHQYDDALVPATKAAELSPDEAPLWRNLGHLNLKLDRLPKRKAHSPGCWRQTPTMQTRCAGPPWSRAGWDGRKTQTRLQSGSSPPTEVARAWAKARA